MKTCNVLLLLLLVLILGVGIGLCVPYRLFTSDCPIPLLSVCSHSFWDWFLRVLQVVGSLAAVIVALFKEDWLAHRYKPSLMMETSIDDLSESFVHEGDCDMVDTYRVKLRLANVGKSAANNLRVYVDSIMYRQSSKSLTSEELLKEPFALLLDKGNDTICLPKYGEVSTEWLSMMKVTPKSSVDGQEYPTTIVMFVGRSFSVNEEYHEGLLDITFKMVCDGIRPQTKTLRVQWNGKWRSRKVDLVGVLGYKWLESL